MYADILGRESFVSHMQGSLGEQTQTAAEESAKAGARSGLDALSVPDSVAVIGATWSTLHSPLIDLSRKQAVTESSPRRSPFSRLASEFFQTHS
jgi:hypothetical protein